MDFKLIMKKTNNENFHNTINSESGFIKSNLPGSQSETKILNLKDRSMSKGKIQMKTSLSS